MKSYIRFIGIPIFVFILFKVDTYKLIEIITEIDLLASDADNDALTNSTKSNGKMGIFTFIYGLFE